jgi:hypothetical protein
MLGAMVVFLVTLLSIGEPSASRGVEVLVRVTNTSQKSQRFCNYHTPFEGFRNNFISITDAQGNEVPYRGMMAKRAAPTRDDYLTLAPGKSEEARVDLRDAYALPPGRYTVHFTGGDISGLPDSTPITLDVPSGAGWRIDGVLQRR